MPILSFYHTINLGSEKNNFTIWSVFLFHMSLHFGSKEKLVVLLGSSTAHDKIEQLYEFFWLRLLMISEAANLLCMIQLKGRELQLQI